MSDSICWISRGSSGRSSVGRGLAERLFSEAEREYAAARARPGQHLAARFCAKEAVTKALALDVLRPLEIEVVAGRRVSRGPC